MFTELTYSLIYKINGSDNLSKDDFYQHQSNPSVLCGISIASILQDFEFAVYRQTSIVT